MKNLLFVLALFTSFSLFSCQRQLDNINNDFFSEEKGSFEQKEFNNFEAVVDVKHITSTHRELLNISKIVGRLSYDKDFRDKVYSNISEKFDGDNNVLVEELFTSSFKNPVLLTGKVRWKNNNLL